MNLYNYTVAERLHAALLEALVAANGKSFIAVAQLAGAVRESALVLQFFNTRDDDGFAALVEACGAPEVVSAFAHCNPAQAERVLSFRDAHRAVAEACAYLSFDVAAHVAHESSKCDYTLAQVAKVCGGTLAQNSITLGCQVIKMEGDSWVEMGNQYSLARQWCPELDENGHKWSLRDGGF